MSALANVSPSTPPSVILVMGVSGSGKTTIAALLAGMLHWELADADSLHPEANVRKMRSGIPLTDEDRAPWLRAVARWIDATRQSGKRGVITCSALKRSHREILIDDRPDVRLAYLKGDRELIARRMVARQGHFMPLALLRSQLETLEEPGPDERAVIVSIAASPHDIALRIIAKLNLQQATHP